MADYLELSLIAHSDDEALLIETALELSGALSITHQAADEREEIFEPPIGTTPLWSHTKVTGLYFQDADKNAIFATLHEILGAQCRVDEKTLADEQWTRAWLDYFKPIPFANHFWVAASEHIIEDKDAIVLRLDPGLAFGTGTHPSTAMCLDYLVHCDLKDKTVYDYGCGSGILGIAAALLGAKDVWQTDIDPQALTASKDNAQKNQVLDRIHLCANPSDAPQVDLLVANILLEPLCFLRSQFEQHLKAHSTMIFAGILERQEAIIAEHYGDRYHIKRVNQQDGWILLELKAK